MKLSLKRWLATATKVVAAFAACLVAFPVVWAFWIARGDPDIRLDQHADYIESIRPVDSAAAPNIVVVFADDLGSGDVGSFGSTAVRTPHIDALAADGARLTTFYAASPVCSPSRFSLLTGRYPPRGFIHSVFFPTGTFMGLLANNFGFPRGIRGIPADEVTVAEALQAAGYRTGMFGKWHLGDRSPHLPTDKGFDHFFGSYYSNDMEPYALYRNDEVEVAAPADQSTLTIRLTQEVLSFIDQSERSPFFAYYATPFPHEPLHASERFAGTSQAGLYGDCVEELDWSVGQIRAALAERGLLERTLILFTSDNGPWYQGSPGQRRGRKANTFDGGHAVPMVASWEGRIPASTEIDVPAMTIDLFPTILAAAGIPLPKDRRIDGRDLMPLLAGRSATLDGRHLYFARGGEFAAVRSAGSFKHVARHRSENSAYWMARHGPFLFDLDLDPTESYDLSQRLPDVSEDLAGALQSMNDALQTNPRGWLEP
ncbi:MAG: sulfatase [Bryobacterales bacterium]|nr:sulfatase [Bryobacterales bacterium]